jgi:hypothetical protein
VCVRVTGNVYWQVWIDVGEYPTMFNMPPDTAGNLLFFRSRVFSCDNCI